MQHRPRTATLLVVLILLGTALFAVEAGALTPDGYVFYQTSANNNILGDNYTLGDFTAGSETVQDVGGVPLWIEAQWSRHRNESLIVSHDASNDINFVATNMSARSVLYTTEFTAGAPITSARSVDVAYESVRGRGIIVWDNATADQVISYSIWNGTALSVNGTIGIVTLATTTRFLRLIPDASSDKVMLIYNDANSDVGAVLWNGSSWVNATNITDDAAVPTNRRPMDYGWYPNGDGAAFYANTTGTGIGYRAFNATSGAWSDGVLASNIGGIPQALDICANPNNDYMGIIVTDSTGDANALMWNGTAIETTPTQPTEDGSIETAGHNSKCEWEKSGRQALFVFVDANVNALHLSFFHYNLSADTLTRAWSTNSINTGSAQVTADIAADDIENLKLRASPYNDSIMITFKDLLLDIRGLRWSGDAMEATSANFVIDGNSATANAQSYELIWNRFPSNPPTITSGVNDSSNSTSPTNEGSNVTFSAIAIDPDGDQWNLLVCDQLGEVDGECYSTTYCNGGLTNSGSIGSCQLNTTGLTLESYPWYAYVCDNSSICQTYENFNNLTSPFDVNHAPSAAPTLSTLVPNATTANITCTLGGSDTDVGDTVSGAYVWWLRNESTGSFSVVSGQSADHINNTHYDSNDQIICQATPIDNHGFAGTAVNTSTATVQNGTLSAQSQLLDLNFPVYGNTTLYANCTVTNGDSENVTLVVQDNRTGTFTESTTTAGSFYVNQSNQSIGRLASTTSPTYSFVVHAETKGAYDVRVQCVATDTNVTQANSSTESLTIVPYTITPTSPANYTRVERDETNSSMADFLLLAVSVPMNVPDATFITYYANLSVPNVAGQQGLSLGITTTSAGAATLFYNPSDTYYAGNYTWWGSSMGGTDNGSRTFTVYGQLNATYNDPTLFPTTTYHQNDTLIVRTNYTSFGPESASNISNPYNASVTARVTSPNGTNLTFPMSFTDPYWNLSYDFLSLGGVGTWTVNTSGGAELFFPNATSTRTMTITGYMNVTENITAPSAIEAFDYATSSCRVQDQHTNVAVLGASVSFYRNGTYLGSNTTNATGHTTLTHQVNSSGVWTITCNMTNQPGIYYDAGDAPQGNSTLTVDQFAITPTSPANGTIVDRDSASADSDFITLTVSVPGTVPDGETIEFLANLTNPVIGGNDNVLIGSNITSGGTAVYNFNPDSTWHAGNWTWFANHSSGYSAGGRIMTLKGALEAQYADNSLDPNSVYFQNETGTVSANVTSNGPETRSDLDATYGITVTSTLLNTTADADALSMVFTNPAWDATHNLLRGVGVWNSTISASGAYWYASGVNRSFIVYGYMNVTSNTTLPASVTTAELATTTCHVEDQHTYVPVIGANVSVYRNGTLVGSALTNNTGDAQIGFITPSAGEYWVLCNVTDEPSIYYYRGDAPSGNTTLTVTAAAGSPPDFETDAQDYSYASAPSNEGSNVTFTANATDPETQNWYLLVCDSDGEAGGSCTDTEICRSGDFTSSTNATCQHNTSGEALEEYEWWAYACDEDSQCSAASNASSPYFVNHAPTASPTLSTLVPNATTANITCTPWSSDTDLGDTVTVSYVWWLRNESTGAFDIVNGQSADHINNTHYDSNDQIICQATPTDNHGFTGTAANTSTATVQNGTLNAQSDLSTSSMHVYNNATLTVNCTVTNGDSENVTLIVQDNSTGSFAQSSTSPNEIYVNVSSIEVGRLVSITSATYNILVRATAIGNYQLRAQCQANDTNITIANSTVNNLEVRAFLLTPLSPVNGTAIDRDELNSTVLDTAPLQFAVETGVPDGLSVDVRVDLTQPTIAGQSDISVGSNTTSSQNVELWWNPAAGLYAGNYTWYGVHANGSMNGTRYAHVFGQLNSTFNDDADNPAATYYQNDTAQVHANLTSLGIETRTNLSAPYSGGINVTFTNAQGSTTLIPTSFTNPYWNGSFTFTDLGGVGVWNITFTAVADYFLENTSVLRSASVYGYMNITENVTSPAAIPLNGNTTTTCRVQDQHTSAEVQGANVSFYRNGTYLGNNFTNSSGHAIYSFQTGAFGDYVVTCNITNQVGIYYYAGAFAEGNSTLTVSSQPPTFNQDVIDGSSAATPTNEADNVTFVGNATDPEAQDWYLLICDAAGVSAGDCDGGEICRSGNVASGTNASCQHNTSGEALEEYEWWAYACDIGALCSAASNASSPYVVNHAPSAAPTLSTLVPNATTANITCTLGGSDTDVGDTVSGTYVWWLRNESTGSFSVVSGQSADHINNTHYDSNDQIICQATPIDNHGFAGTAVNTSTATVQNGTLSADSNLAELFLLRGASTSLNISCTVTAGDAESVTLLVQDNRTGTYTQSNTSSDDVYVSQASFSLGRIASTTLLQTVTLYTLTAGNYSIRAQCLASDANVTVANSTAQNLEVSPDSTPPVITDVEAINIHTSGATITWSTDDNSDGLVEYGMTLGLGNSTFDPSLVTSHSITLTNLSPSTTYYYNVTSCNADGYCATNGTLSFTTDDVVSGPAQYQEGACTAVVVEQGPNYREGYLSPGDVVDFYCEMPHEVGEREPVQLTISADGKEVTHKLVSPSNIYGQEVVIYP